MGKLLIYCYSITFFEIIVIVSAIKKIVIATWSGADLNLHDTNTSSPIQQAISKDSMEIAEIFSHTFFAKNSLLPHSLEPSRK